MAAALEILTVAEMTEAEALAIAAGTPGMALMENAGAAAAAEITRRWSRQEVIVLCGPGNNGGDGFVTARHLRQAGWPVTLALLGSRDRLRGDAAQAAAQWPDDVHSLEPAVLRDDALVVDAMFGAGLARPIEGAARAAIEAINQRGQSCVAVDLPSGIHGDTGRVLGAAPRCSLTVTFFRRKLGHVLMPGRRLAGEIVTADIGIPDSVLATIQPKFTENQPAAWLRHFPRPRWDDHKYRRGHVLVAGGAVMTGAARLASAAARRAGAGLVTIACPPESHAIYAAGSVGVITAMVGGDQAFAELLADGRRNVLVIGPGHGLTESTKQRTLAGLKSGKACVLDADALTVFAERPAELFEAIQSACVLTPHDGEFARLFPSLVSVEGKVARALHAARLSRAVVLLKGPDTIIASPDGRAFINTNGPPTLATGGTGDVLTGLVAGYLAQDVPPFEAAAIAVWVQGAAAVEFGPGLLAEDLIDGVPEICNYIMKLTD